MKTAAMSVWIFINLLFFGMCGYLYLIWSQYWLYMEKQKYFATIVETPRPPDMVAYQEDISGKYILNHNSVFINHKIRRSAIGAFMGNNRRGIISDKSSVNHQNLAPNKIVRNKGNPRFPNLHQQILEFDTEKFVCDDLDSMVCVERTARFKEALLKEFHRVLMDEGKVFKSGLDEHNIYNVRYERNGDWERSRQEIMCALKGVLLRTVTADDEPFRSNGFRIPRDALQGGKVFNTCAVVTSAGTLRGAQLGSFIDEHDMVLRFNNAPVQNYTEDVGSKTTIRILNSQVVSKPEFDFLNDPLYKNVSIIIWDPANYSSSIEDWFYHPDFPLFEVYKQLLRDRPRADVHLLRPEMLWQLWAVLQDSTPYRLRRNPPSSGFIGLWISLHRCKLVRIFEYVPSSRVSRRCHYYSERTDAGCTLGSWHPLAQEKALVERLRENSDIDVFQRGYVELPGFSTLNCV